MAKPKPKPKTKRSAGPVAGPADDSHIPSYDEWAKVQPSHAHLDAVSTPLEEPGWHEVTDPELIVMDNCILPNYRLSIYFASKLQHANIGKLLLAEWTEFQWTSRWPQCHVGKVPQQPNYAKVFWEHKLEDVQKANVVLVYSKPEDVLRGALVEAGMAIALGKRVVVVGENDSYDTWQHHPLVFQASNLAEARQLLRTLAL